MSDVKGYTVGKIDPHARTHGPLVEAARIAKAVSEATARAPRSRPQGDSI